jgi:hypothetical protein
MQYIIKSELLSDQIKTLIRRGGNYSRAAQIATDILLNRRDGVDVFTSLKRTNHGETRIKNCVKYDLPGYCRLITIQENGVCSIEFLGDHDECDRWLINNQGLTLSIDKSNTVKAVQLTDKIEKDIPIRTIYSRPTEKNLLEKIKESYIEVIADNVPYSVFKELERFDFLTDENEILEICLRIKEEEIRNLVFDVLMYLKEDNVDGAKDLIHLYTETNTLLAKATDEQVSAIESNEQYLKLEDFSGKDIQTLMNGYTWYEWMLFMHPQQRVVTDRDFSGSARLLGVSGSGKTCVIINRALRLANKYPNEKILITTLNSSLADLIRKLLNVALEYEINKDLIKTQIDVFSLHELMVNIIEEKKSIKTYRDLLNKTYYEVDVLWSNFYFGHMESESRELLKPIHQSLLKRNTLPKNYIKQEFDWIRSAVSTKNREEYMSIDRTGRAEAFNPDFRRKILKSLEEWEDIMENNLIFDESALFSKIANELTDIKPLYRCILIDEYQDFGTTELAFIRKLVHENENDVFLCGDAAQQVHTKNQILSKTGIKLNPSSTLKITKNYRNSREILEAAFEMFNNNIKPEQYNNREFELLDPELANFSSPKPLIRWSNDLQSEFNFSLEYLRQQLEPNEKGCIAVCGFSFNQVKYLADCNRLVVLDGKNSVDDNNIFISDLNQTKGFEFDKMIVINCNANVFPNPQLPKDELFRDISKLYVAMTRAKKELIISHSSELSDVFSMCKDKFTFGTEWKDYFFEPNFDTTFKIEVSEEEQLKINDIQGEEFIYSKYALGLSQTAQEKILQIVSGKTVTNPAGMKEECKNIGEFIEMISNTRLNPQTSNFIGRTTIDELRKHFNIQLK